MEREHNVDKKRYERRRSYDDDPTPWHPTAEKSRNCVRLSFAHDYLIGCVLCRKVLVRHAFTASGSVLCSTIVSAHRQLRRLYVA
jgi:hypothetical protein